MKPYYVIRWVGGLLYLSGGILMVWNVWMTIAGRLREEAPLTDAPHDPDKDRPLPRTEPVAQPVAAE